MRGAAAALRGLFGANAGRKVDFAAGAALEWAARSAVERGAGKAVVLAVDDVDRADGASLSALAELLRARSVSGFSVLMTSERLPDAAVATGVSLRGLRGSNPKQARELLAGKGFKHAAIAQRRHRAAVSRGPAALARERRAASG